MLSDMVYLRLKSGVFHKTSSCCSPNLTEAKEFKPIGGTFGRRPLRGGRGGGDSDLNGQIPLEKKIRKSKVDRPLGYMRKLIQP